MNNTENEYRQWLVDLKQRIRQSQIKAAVKVNTELLLLYWEMGRDIVARQMEASWGSKILERLSKDLLQEFPNMKGFSSTNLKYCKRFYLFYTQDNTIRPQIVDEIGHQVGDQLQIIDNKENIILHQVGEVIRQQLVDELQPIDNKGNTILQQVVDEFNTHPIFQIPWGHHIQIFTKCKTVHEALFYVQKSIKNGWSRAVLMNFMEADLYAAQGKALNILPEVQSDRCTMNFPQQDAHTRNGERFLLLRNLAVEMTATTVNRETVPKVKKLNRKGRKGFSQSAQMVNGVIAGNDPQSPARRFALGDSCFRRNDGVTRCVLCAFFANLAVKRLLIQPSPTQNEIYNFDFFTLKRV